MRKYHPRQCKAYLIRDRICCRCGSNRTDDRIINHVLWHREYNEKGESTGRWKCNKCYMKDYQKMRQEMAGIIEPIKHIKPIKPILTTKKDN